MCVGGVNECHSSFILCYLLKSWVEYINQASIQRVLGNRNCFSAMSKRGSLIFTQGVLELSESVATIKMGVDSKDTKGSQKLPKERDFETPLYPKRAQKWFSVLSVSGEERRGEDCPISPRVCSPRRRTSSLLSKKYLLQLNFLLGSPWHNSKKDWTGILVLPLAGCVTWGPLRVLVPSR